MYIVSKVQSEQQGGRVVGNDLYPAPTYDAAIATRNRLIESNDTYFGNVVPDRIDGRVVFVHAGRATIITYDIVEV